MEKETKMIGGRACTLCRNGQPKWLLIQPVDDHDLERLDGEVADMVQGGATDFLLAAFRVDNWMDELTPWPAPPTYSRQPFGEGAAETLRYVLDELLPALESDLTGDTDDCPHDGSSFPPDHCILSGYSLAGFFALWAATQTDRFGGVGGVSASVWYPRFLDYAVEHPLRSPRVYLSIGDKERKARNALMASNQTCMELLTTRLKDEGRDAIMELNPGNHFMDTDHRVARGFLWLMGQNANE